MLPSQTHPPNEPIPRRHTPPRAEYRTYRSCLRWEFGFTCAFCLLHEADFVEGGARGTTLMWIEHHVAQSADQRLIDVYENCFYACGYCNRARKIVPVARAGRHLLQPCAVAWGEHFVVVGDELRPREGDADAAHTHTVYQIDAPRKVACRESRRQRLDDAHRAVRECPDEIRELLSLAGRLAGAERSVVLRQVERLRRDLVEAEEVFDRYRAIPVDQDGTCRCNATHELPAFLAMQVAAAT